MFSNPSFSAVLFFLSILYILYIWNLGVLNRLRFGALNYLVAVALYYYIGFAKTL